ncbi:hypothetical protein [Cellulomonas sp. PhB143]|uniref:hypothetical protein n=1 Tax=Cellulomonas sp. PhB143 TaxID=2485186 RepID=UPI000F468C36|nr:hypothetical protein [Cellulomonas sp. PhB143]ROS78864.1 hypothetical protein EDF32_0773 [Cellulomonas sp. PhB143]
MTASTRAVATAVAAAALAAAAFLGEVPLGLVLLALAGLLAAGWPSLLDLPAPLVTRVVIALAGVAAVGTVHLTDGDQALANLPLVLAFAVVVAFAAEMARRDGRVRLVDSVTGSVAGAVVAVASAGWLATGPGEAGVGVVVACAAGLAVAAAFSAVDFHAWWGEGLTVLVGVVASGVTGALLAEVGLVRGLGTGLVAGLLVAASHALFGRLEVASTSRTAALAAIVLPVSLGGSLVYVVGRVLGAA